MPSTFSVLQRASNAGNKPQKRRRNDLSLVLVRQYHRVSRLVIQQKQQIKSENLNTCLDLIATNPAHIDLPKLLATITKNELTWTVLPQK